MGCVMTKGVDANAVFVYGFNKGYILSNSLVIFLIYICFIMIFFMSSKRKKIGMPLFILLFGYHTTLAMLMYYNGIADSIGYYNVAASSTKLTISILGKYDIFFMYALLFPLIHFLKLTYLSCTLIFNLLGFGGLIFFYLALLDYLQLENGKGTYLPYLLFFPSLSVWTGFAGKDAISFFALCLFLYALVNIKKRLLFAIVALVLLIHVRPYMFIIFSLAFLLAVVFSKDTNLFLKTILVIAAIGLLFVGQNIFAEKQNIDLTNVEQSQKLLESSQGAWGGGSDIDISNYNILLKILSFLYRPLFIDAHSIMMFLSSTENLILLIISLCFFKPKFYKIIFADKTLFAKFNFFYFIIATILLSHVNANLGTIVRKRIMVTISMMALMAIYYYKEQIILLSFEPEIRQTVEENQSTGTQSLELRR